MAGEFFEKTSEFKQKVTECIDAGRFLDAIGFTNDCLAYMDNYVKTHTESEDWKNLYFSNYRSIWSLNKYILETRNDLETLKKEVEGKIFDLQRRVSELEK